MRSITQYGQIEVMARLGFSRAAIAKAVGLSRGRVRMALNRLRKAGRLPHRA